MEVTRDILEQYYVTEDRTREETAELLGVKPYVVSNYVKLFGLKKLSAAQKLEQLKVKYPVELLKEVYDRLGYGGTITELGIKAGDLDKLVKEYQIGKRGKQARIEARIDPEALKQYYIRENHSFTETATHFSCTGGQLRQLLGKLGIRKGKEQILEVSKRNCLEKYGVESINRVQEVKDRKRQVIRDRYGVDNIFQLPELREKNIERIRSKEVKAKRIASLQARTKEQWKESSDQGKATKLERYGEDYQSQFASKAKATYLEQYGVPYSVPGHEKMKQTNLERYGIEQYSLSDEGKAKIRQSKFEKYGGYFNREKVAETKEERYGDPTYSNRAKAKATMMERYGATNSFQSKELLQRVSEGIQKKYGVMWNCVRPEARHSTHGNNSKPNLHFAQLLEANGIEYEREFPIANRSYDFKVGNILIEIDPFATHNSTWGIKGGEPKDPTYHVSKTVLARENGYQCMHIWDWDNLDKVIQILKPKQKIYARKCKIKEIDQRTANKFLDQYHLQGGAKMQTVCLALYLGEELIQVMTFGKPRFNKHYRWELIRLCTKAEFMVIGGSDRLHKHFMDKYQPDSIISYCDMAKFTGNVYTQLGLTMKSCSNPSRHWFNPETGRQLSDNGIRMLGFDKLCNASYGKGTRNDELLREHGWCEIWDAGQAVYIWNRK